MNYEDYPLAFISSPYNGEDEEIIDNVKRARAMCRWAMDNGFAPFASHLIYTQFLDDRISEERKMGIEIGRAYMKNCSAVIRYVDRISEGTAGDAELLNSLCIREIQLTEDDIKEYYDKNTFLPPWAKA